MRAHLWFCVFVEFELPGRHTDGLLQRGLSLHMLCKLRPWEAFHYAVSWLYLGYQVANRPFRRIFQRDVAWAAYAFRCVGDRHGLLLDWLVHHSFREKHRFQDSMSYMGQYDPRWRNICLQDWSGHTFVLPVKVPKVVPLLDQRVAIKHARSCWWAPFVRNHWRLDPNRSRPIPVEVSESDLGPSKGQTPWLRKRLSKRAPVIKFKQMTDPLKTNIYLDR